MFGDLFKMLSQQGPDAWFANATQMALTIARGDDGDPNPEPSQRQRLEELAPLVARHVTQRWAVAVSDDVETLTRGALTSLALEQWRPLVTPMVTATTTLDLPIDDPSNMMAQMAGTLGPLFWGFQLGSVAGHFSERAWSLAVLPLPRLTSKVSIAVNNVGSFADEWSLPRDVVYVFALAQEMISALILSQPGVSDALRFILADTVRQAAATQGDIMSKLQGMMNPENLAALSINPEQLLDGLDLPESTEATRALDAALGALLAVGDQMANDITSAIMGPNTALSEAWRRHRLSDARGEDAAAALFGASLQGEHHERARQWVTTLLADVGEAAFTPLLRVDGLPSDEELSSPMQWWTRVSTSPLA